MLNIPIRDQVDDLVLESSLGACALAGTLAAAGRRVLLVGRGLSPGREAAIACRAWLEAPEAAAALAGPAADMTEGPADFASLVQPALGDSLPDGGRLLDLTALTTAIEDWLLEAGVRLLYDQSPAGLIVDDVGAVHGVLLGGKAGLFGILAARVIDASDTGVLTRIAGAQGASPQDGASVVADWVSFADGIPDALTDGLIAPSLSLRRRGPWLQWTARLATDPTRPEWRGDLASAMRQRVVQAMPLLRSRPVCNALRLVRGADALLLHGLSRSEPFALPSGLLAPSDLPADGDRLDALGLAGCWRAGIDLARRLSAPAGRSPGSSPTDRLRAQTAPPGSATVDPAWRWGCADPAAPAAPLGSVPWDGAVAATDRAALIVVGGGTSGLPAAIEAARQGCHVRLIEKFADAGGTQTLGGVPHYWYGRTTAYLQAHDQKLADFQGKSGFSLALAKAGLLLESGVEMEPPATVVGVGYAGRRLMAVLSTCGRGLMLRLARNFIDATGDGDLAAWAGHPYAYGSGADDATFWYSFGKFVGERDAASREYHSVVDLRDPVDLTRAVITSRRRDGIYGRGNIPAFYLAPRESRRITGRATLTYRDILLDRCPPDCLILCRSNFDIKGIGNDPLLLAGFVDPDFHRNFDAAIPWRALLPRDLDNLVVAGKAFSASHEALALARMQRDLIALGATAGLAGALAGEGDVAALPFEVLRRAAIAAGLLRPEDTTSAPTPNPLALLAALDADALDLQGQLHLITLAPELADALRSRFSRILSDGADPARDIRPPGDGNLRALPLLAARILWQATADSQAGDCLLAALDRGLTLDPLPDTEGQRGRHEDPDHGWAPWPCYLIHALAQGGYRKLIPRLVRLAAQLPARLERSDRHFHYVFAIARAAEQFADPAAGPALRALWRLEWLRRPVVPMGRDPRVTGDVARERFAYLALCLARAAVACKLPEGRRRLDSFTRDQRHWLAASAEAPISLTSGNTG